MNRPKSEGPKSERNPKSEHCVLIAHLVEFRGSGVQRANSFFQLGEFSPGPLPKAPRRGFPSALVRSK